MMFESRKGDRLWSYLLFLLLKQNFQASAKHTFDEGVISLMGGDGISLNETLAT